MDIQITIGITNNYKLNRFVLILCFLITSCNPYEKYLKVELNTELNVTVNKHYNERGGAIINNNYLLDSAYPLLNEKSNVKERGFKEFYFMANRLPYKLQKRKGDDFFYTIKNNDTLKFKLLIISE